MTPIVRRLVYVLAYEAIGICVAGLGLAAMTGAAVIDTGSFALTSSLVATLVNLGYTWAFEVWEARQARRGRSLLRRIGHAVGLEVVLTVALVPLLAWWLALTLFAALVYNLAITLFFLLYTFVFNWAFDALFGLPASAR